MSSLQEARNRNLRRDMDGSQFGELRSGSDCLSQFPFPVMRFNSLPIHQGRQKESFSVTCPANFRIAGPQCFSARFQVKAAI